MQLATITHYMQHLGTKESTKLDLGKNPVCVGYHIEQLQEEYNQDVCATGSIVSHHAAHIMVIYSIPNREVKVNCYCIGPNC